MWRDLRRILQVLGGLLRVLGGPSCFHWGLRLCPLPSLWLVLIQRLMTFGGFTWVWCAGPPGPFGLLLGCVPLGTGFHFLKKEKIMVDISQLTFQ